MISPRSINATAAVSGSDSDAAVSGHRVRCGSRAEQRLYPSSTTGKRRQKLVVQAANQAESAGDQRYDRPWNHPQDSTSSGRISFGEIHNIRQAEDVIVSIAQDQSPGLVRHYEAVQKAAVDLLSSLGMPGIYDPSSGIRARQPRLWATKEYISFAGLRRAPATRAGFR